MAVLAVTNTFVDATTAQASQVNTNFSDIVSYVNNRNDGTSAWDALRVTTASDIVAILDNSSGTSDILRCRDNGTVCAAISDGGATVLTATGAATVPLTVNNGTSTGNIFLAQDNGSAIMTIADGGALTYDGAAVFNEAGADVDFRIEGDTVTGLFLVDASADMVSIDSLHVGGTSDPGADNLIVDGTCAITGLTTTTGGVHVGGTSDPGADNLLVDGTATITGVTTFNGNITVGDSAAKYVTFENESRAIFYNAAGTQNTVFYHKVSADGYGFEIQTSDAIGVVISKNLCINSSANHVPTYGGGVGVLRISDTSTVPSSDPTGGGLLYVQSGSLKYRGSSGTVTVLAAA